MIFYVDRWVDGRRGWSCRRSPAAGCGAHSALRSAFGKAIGAAVERVGAGGGGRKQRASSYGRRLALLPAWGGCSTTDTARPKPPGSSISRCLCPRKTPAIQSRQWNNASKQTTQPDGSPCPECDAPHLHSPSPLSQKLPLLLFRMLSNGRCGRPLLSGKPRSSGKQRAGGKNASRTPAADSGTHHSTAGRRGCAGRRAPSAGGGALWAPHHAAGDRRHDHPRRPSTQRCKNRQPSSAQAVNPAVHLPTNQPTQQSPYPIRLITYQSSSLTRHASRPPGSFSIQRTSRHYNPQRRLPHH